MLLGAFSELGFASPLLRAALEHGLLRTAPEIPAGACRLALRGALDVGMGVRSAAVRALLRRCTSELPQVPIEELVPLRELDEVVRARAEEEVLGLSEAAAGALSALARVERVPLEVHLFGEAVAMRSKRANWSLG
ncbi:unnamed protein product [Prorocentrum cordatum]|uniref:Uncharacterized protein n=1 Tax=Prorocentrum cordatum TaxID=2364126 RepID=A0ABN9XEL6_9DINO|nr:unnamed protein product [Polarella glacialis]